MNIHKIKRLFHKLAYYLFPRYRKSYDKKCLIEFGFLHKYLIKRGSWYSKEFIDDIKPKNRKILLNFFKIYNYEMDEDSTYKPTLI